MEHICEYCRGYVRDSDESCPTCGAPNPNYGRMANGIPQTIEELKQYAVQNNLPLDKMRFFIGQDYKGAKAFGIFERDGVYTVYKNKADGTRAVRYEGRDEAYAVNELYQKMHAEVIARKAAMQRGRGSAPQQNQNYNQNQQPGTPKRSPKGCTCLIGLIVLSMVFVPLVSFLFSGVLDNLIPSQSSPTSGYYYYDNDYYYYRNNDWYEYDNGWRRVTPSSGLTNNWDDYYYGSYYSDSMDAEDFTETSYYDSYSQYSSDDDYDNDYDNNTDWDNGWDNDDTWDTGNDWDTGATDWDSDW